MSGYAAEEQVREEVSRGHIRFLQKPFTASTLAEELRGLLGSGPGALATQDRRRLAV